MPKFTYIATSRSGQKSTGEVEAETRDEVANSLHQQGLVVVSIDENLALDLDSLMNIQIGGVPLAERVIFAKQLSTMIAAGLPLIQALNIMVQQTENKAMRENLLKVYKSVEAGTSLSDSFRREGKIFNELQVSLIEAGEKSGTLNEIMLRIAEELEKSKKLRSKIVGAMIYPVIIFFVMIIVFVLLIVFMVPSVKDLYADFGSDELPAVTQFLVTLGEAFTNPFFIAIAAILIVSVVGGLRYYYSTEKGRRGVDGFLLKFPVFGPLLQKIQLAQFTRLLALLLRSGVPIVDALNTVANAMGNSLFEDAVKRSALEVQKGSSLTIPLAESNIFPIILLKMISTGEETGKLDQIAYDMAIYYEEEVNELTSNLTRLMEPFILLIVGGMVAFIAVAIYLPLYSLGQLVE